ncbi:hypothetical protein FPV67DRAFT_1408578, partial [Lyophyllum atratum]
HVIDPALYGLPPLPDSDDEDLIDGPTIAKAHGRTPAAKVAGSRQKGKGKQRAVPSSSKGKQRASAPDSSQKRKAGTLSSDEDVDEPDLKRGHPRGAGNYHPDDVTELLNAVEAELPLGQRGWLAIHRRYTKWAHKHDRPDTVKSLETKYKQLIKTTMPTGDGYCPPDVKTAHSIEELINERACTRDLDDSDFDGDASRTNAAVKSDDDDNDDNVEIVDPPAVKKAVSAIIRHPDLLAPGSRRKTRVNGMELVAKLADPLQNTHYLTLSQQFRDSQMTTESLRNQVPALNSRLHDAERARDRADMKLELQELAGGRQSSASWS